MSCQRTTASASVTVLLPVLTSCLCTLPIPTSYSRYSFLLTIAWFVSVFLSLWWVCLCINKSVSHHSSDTFKMNFKPLSLLFKAFYLLYPVLLSMNSLHGIVISYPAQFSSLWWIHAWSLQGHKATFLSLKFSLVLYLYLSNVFVTFTCKTCLWACLSLHYTFL